MLPHLSPAQATVLRTALAQASYTVDGRQFIVVGGNTQLDFKRGNSIIAFTLAE